MIDPKLLKLLNVNAVGLFLQKVELTNYGRDVSLHFVGQFSGAPPELCFRLDFRECASQSWNLDLDSFDPQGSESANGLDVIGVHLGVDNHVEDFYIHTSELVLNISYGCLVCTLV